MEIQIHRGNQQIGGSVIELRSGDSRVLLDAGLPLEAKPGEALLPPSLDPEGLSGILLTHAHPDHYGLIEHITKGAPVYLTEGSSKVLLASSLFVGTRSIPRERVQTVTPMEAFDVGPFSITPIPVDHSAFDPVAYSIQAQGKHILYTGDLRAHGRKPGMLHQLKRYCREHPVDLMVTEGTRISEPGKNSLSEADVESLFRDIYTNAAGLVLNWFSPLNVDRWVSAYRALGKHRCFVHDLYTEFLHYLIKSQVPSIPLEREAKNLRVYCPANQAKRLEYKGIRNFVVKTKLKIESDLTQAIHPPENSVMLFRPSMLSSVFHGAFPRNTDLIVSLWSGYTRNKTFEAVEKAINECGGKIHYVHASGHIYAKDLIGLIQDINPKKLIPVHTEDPERFLGEFPQTHLAQDGEAIQV